MYFENGEEDAEDLKQFILGKLESICEADPYVLADYIVTLLRHDVKSEAEMIEFCKSQLQDFLLDNTDGFIKLLFGALKSKSYLKHRGSKALRGRDSRRLDQRLGGRRHNPMDGNSRLQRHSDRSRRVIPNLSRDQLPLDVADHLDNNGTVASDDYVAKSRNGGGASRHRGPVRDQSHIMSAPPPHVARYNPKNTNTVLVMENIPEEHLNIKDISDAMGKFGSILNITIQPRSTRAVVHFSSNYEAHQAYTNPESYFNNRFVKVYWFKDDSVAAIEQAKLENHAKRKEELKKRAIESHEEQVAQLEQRKKLMQQKIEEEAQRVAEQNQLLAKQQEEAKNLMQMIEVGGASLAAEQRQEIMDKLKAANVAIQDTLQRIKSFVSSTPTVKRSVIDDDSAMDDVSMASGESGTPATQFRYSAARGRGRGFYSAKKPTPFMGAQPGASSLSLDMRPKKILIKWEEGSVDKVNTLFSQFGSVEFVIAGSQPNTFCITFSARWEAEKAMFAITKANSSSEPGVVPKMEAMWIENNAKV